MSIIPKLLTNCNTIRLFYTNYKHNNTESSTLSYMTKTGIKLFCNKKAA